MIRLITVIFLASTLLISCSKDDTGTKNHFKAGYTEYAPSTVYMRRLGPNSSGKNYITNLVLWTGGFLLLKRTAKLVHFMENIYLM